MNNRSQLILNFQKVLKVGLMTEFGKIPATSEFADQFNLRAYGTNTISRETARKWKSGIVLPAPANLQVLMEWLNLDIEDIYYVEHVSSSNKIVSSVLKK
jgi:hypothetical protein